MRRSRLATAVLGAAALAVSATAAQALQPSPQRTLLTTQLSGQQETQAADPDGIGTAAITVFDYATGTDKVCIAMAVRRVALPAIGLHIHLGNVGVAGPVVVPFNPPPIIGGYTKCADVVNGQALIDNLEANPSQYYLNIHNSTYPAGAIRGQLR